MLLARRFSAGTIRCSLTRLGGSDTWLIAGVQVQVDEGYLPSGPLLTWHDTEPFQDPPEAPPQQEDGGEEAAEAA